MLQGSAFNSSNLEIPDWWFTYVDLSFYLLWCLAIVKLLKNKLMLKFKRLYIHIWIPVFSLCGMVGFC